MLDALQETVALHARDTARETQPPLAHSALNGSLAGLEKSLGLGQGTAVRFDTPQPMHRVRNWRWARLSFV